MYSHILVPTNGSEVSQKGVDHALALAKALGARVTIVTVTEPLPSYLGVPGAGFALGAEIMATYDDQRAQFAADILTKAQQEAVALGIPASVLHVPNSHPADAIVDAAKSLGAGLIVMASHGRRGLGRLLIGSQVSGVVNHSTVPVLVVR